jgi:hypothetical protein
LRWEIRMDENDEQANHVEAFALTLVFATVSFALFLLLPWQTRPGPENSGWWTQPSLMPGIALGVLALANLESLRRAYLQARHSSAADRAAARIEIWGWFRPIEFFVYFLIYLFSLKYLGYFLSTALFIQFLLWRSKLRSMKWRLAGLGAALVMTIIFRWGLGIWVPTAELYDVFPDAARKFLTRWF